MSTGRIDVVTIFPEFFDLLDVSLIGRARRAGSLQLGVHDLREWTSDRHRTVDDTPAGGGAGMVMRADVWGAALDDTLEEDRATLVIPTPGGEPFTQHMAEEWATRLAGGGQIVIACGRYEGIDSRVAEHYRTRVEVKEVSIGDYVLNGGESAAVVMIEAVGRLVPGVLGNPASLVEESHGADGLLEYPVYTAPATWRGQQIPEVLRSGDHARIEAWRRARALERTAQVRPDLLTGHEVSTRRARASDAARLHEIARRTFLLACPPGFAQERAEEFVNDNLTVDHFRAWARARGSQLWVVEIAGVVVGYALVHLRAPSPDLPGEDADRTADLNKFYLLPEHHGSPVSGRLMAAALAGAQQAGMTRIWLGVNQLNPRAQGFYRKHGFEVAAERTFTVAGDPQKDFVMERTLDFTSLP